MSINFADYVRLSIPEGSVTKITRKSDGVVLWEKGYVNQVPISTDTDGSIFNGCGYSEGYRLSSSGALKAQTGSVTTGFIPCSSVSDVIRMKGATWGTTVSAGYSYIIFYNSNYVLQATANLYQMNDASSKGGTGISNGSAALDMDASTIIEDEDGVTTFNIVLLATSPKSVAYFRINATGSGADMIVTVNEEIT